MAAKKANNYIDVDLDWAEAKLAEWKAFVDSVPYKDIQDRKELQLNKRTGGTFEAVVQLKENIQKSFRDTMKDYFTLLAEVKRLRQADDAAKEKEAKGTAEVPFRMRKEKEE